MAKKAVRRTAQSIAVAVVAAATAAAAKVIVDRVRKGAYGQTLEAERDGIEKSRDKKAAKKRQAGGAKRKRPMKKKKR